MRSASGTWTVAVAPFEGGVIVGFEAGEGSIEHFPARHDDDIEAGGHACGA